MIAISTAEEFHTAVAAATEKPLVACFSAPWCGGCKLVAPKVEKLAEELAKTVSFAKVSAEELETLCEEVEVDSFPHFRVYKEGKIIGDYTSSKFDKVDAFIRGHVAPDTVEKTEETPEGEAVQEETAEEVPAHAGAEAEGSKKRQERDEMKTNDEQIAKKAKTEEVAPEEAETEEATEPVENVEEAAKEETETAGKESTAEKDEAARAEKAEATETNAAPVDAAAA
ncbi:hypothetical protein PC129_g14793 [Phytophthora cactorum]|uniref:Thioredoxin domain-containing protein n=1 Tax=Phytophthora cactorum TaxID=29920 RepID=A0A8T1BLW4_9STRA|nr:hypothetical protein Pcac1_g577 [Phytophthora cactorum]KAG2889344.1 hypothetical protein PC114_g17999 [Phytophthora cactorum]KAG2902484.1 hypothetical protein PC115_g15588 [Phytophthora cactorum]KAG3097214.1 hypothetical protein PC122_g4617 [Phytophthora cactorum]KAG3214297.1 hypothetical protein PC129_g14793 [Phytophthora cactorum]